MSFRTCVQRSAIGYFSCFSCSCRVLLPRYKVVSALLADTVCSVAETVTEISHHSVLDLANVDAIYRK